MNSARRPRSLVSGAAGFIGSTLADRLARAGNDLVLIDDLSTGQLTNLRSLGQTLLRQDISEVRSAHRVDQLFHLAAQTDVRASVANPARDAHVNIEGTINLVSGAIEGGCQVIILASTGGALYGDDAPLPTSEAAPPRPVSPYGLGKWSAERYMDLLTAAAAVRGVSLALSNVYGPRQTISGDAGVVAAFLSKMLKGDPTVIYGNGSQTRDLVYVEDVVDAFIAASEIGSATGRYNIGTGHETSVIELWERCAAITDYSLKPRFEEARAGEVHRSCLDPSRAARELSWQPRTPLETGLQATAEWVDALLTRG